MTDRPALATMVIQANPVQDPVATAEHLDAYQSLLTLIDERSGAMDHHTLQADTPTNIPPPPPRSRVAAWAFAAAFILILVVIGAAALILGGDDSQVTDEPASSTTVPETPTSVVETPTTIAEAPPPPVTLDDTGRFQQTRLSEPWTRDIVDVASLPSGGFVVATSTPRVLWSPDGVEWIGADPQRQVTAATPRWWNDQLLPAVISVVGDRVVVLDGIDPGLWVGNPRAGEWESIRLDTAGIAGQVEPFAVASSDTEVLVLAEHRPKLAPGEIETVSQPAESWPLVWLVNPQTGEAKWRSLTPTRVDPETEDLEGASGAVAWVNDRWVMALGDAILVSGDGVTWTQVPGEDTFDTGLAVNALAAGPAGVIATTCGAMGPHDVYFSEDGLNWENTHVPLFHAEAAYTDGLGFVVPIGEEDGPDQFMVSPDGRTWHAKTLHAEGRYSLGLYEIQNLAASGQTVFVDHSEGAMLLTYE